MKIRNVLSACCLLMLLYSCNSSVKADGNRDTTAVPKPLIDTGRHISILDTEGLKLIDTTAVIEIIGTGFIWSEGPLYINDGDYLLFSDVPANRVYKWKEGQGTSVYLTPSGYTGTIPKEKEPGSNGLVLDMNGRLVLCQQGNRQIGRMKTSLQKPVPLFETISSVFEGKKFNSPNDAVYATNGNLYFTDPPYGLEHGMKDSTKEIDFQGVYCTTPQGKVKLVTDKVSYPNGIALSPDNKYLYISNSDNENKEWLRFELDKEGMPVNESVFYRVSAEEGKLSGNPDGMKIDQHGYIFASGPGGIWIFNSTAKVIARIYTGQQTSNCFLDQVHHVLYMTCKSYVMRLKLK